VRVGIVCERMLTGFGVDLAVDKLAQGLSERGHEVVVYCALEDGTYRDRGYRIRLIPTTPSRVFPLTEYRARKWARLLDQENLDVVQVHTFPFFRLLPLLSTPTVAVDHGVSPTMGMPRWLRADFAYAKARLHNDYLPRASEVVTISDFLRDGMPADVSRRATVIPWGTEHYFHDVTDTERREFRARVGASEDSVLSLYVGRLNQAGQPYKGVGELLEHFVELRAKTPSADLLCIGFGDHGDAAEIRRAGAIPLIKAPASEMATAYSAADLVVTCSRWEGFGLPLAEAQRFGRPAVAYNIGAHPEICLPGESAILVDSPSEFREGWERLLDDPGLRQRMGAAGRRFTEQMTWPVCVDRHEEVLRRAAGTGRGASVAGSLRPRLAVEPEPVVSVIVLSYSPEMKTLGACLDSVLASDYARIELLLVDNGSGDGGARAAAATRPGVSLLELDSNSGFSGGINRGVAASSGALCFILNPDTVIAPDAISELVRCARRHPRAVGFAAKMLFMHDHDLIDSIGIAVDGMGSAFNRGIGQFDIGQFDREEVVLGACFGAAMIRRWAFDRASVGPLDESYFLYYEDVDWCIRATLLGEDFWTAPTARVFHVHSATTREQDYGFKYRLIERNLLRTVFRSFEKRRVVDVFAARSRTHLGNIVKRRFPVASARILREGWQAVPQLWSARIDMQLRRVRADVDLLKLSYGENPYFDPINYAPIYSWGTLLAMLRRLWLISGEERWERAYHLVVAASESPLRFRPMEVLRTMETVADPLPPALRRFFVVMSSEPAMLVDEPEVAPELESALGPGEGARTA